MHKCKFPAEVKIAEIEAYLAGKQSMRSIHAGLVFLQNQCKNGLPNMNPWEQQLLLRRETNTIRRN